VRLLTLICTTWLVGCSGAPEPAEPAEVTALEALPGDSLYHLDTPLIDQHGDAVPLSVFAGQPVLISMFYASCPSACPMLISDIKSLEEALTDAERANLRVLLVSLDPVADTPAQLASVIDQHGLDTDRWRLTAPAPEHVRDIAAVLGISYQAIDGGELHHSSIITLLDSRGTPVIRLEGLRQSPEPLLAALRGL
jgi:protein SCO1/2